MSDAHSSPLPLNTYLLHCSSGHNPALTEEIQMPCNELAHTNEKSQASCRHGEIQLLLETVIWISLSLCCLSVPLFTLYWFSSQTDPLSLVVPKSSNLHRFCNCIVVVKHFQRWFSLALDHISLWQSPRSKRWNILMGQASITVHTAVQPSSGSIKTIQVQGEELF